MNKKETINGKNKRIFKTANKIKPENKERNKKHFSFCKYLYGEFNERFLRLFLIFRVRVNSLFHGTHLPNLEPSLKSAI